MAAKKPENILKSMGIKMGDRFNIKIMAEQKRLLHLQQEQLKAKDKRIDELQKALDVAMVAIELGSKLNSYSDAVNTKYECNESKQKIQEILKGGNDE